jgi:hypothetical protein
MTPFERLADDGVVGGIHDRGEPRLHELALSAGADVVSDLGGAYYATGRVFHGRHRDRHFDASAVLGDPHRFEVIDTATGPDGSEHLISSATPSAGMISVIFWPTASAAVQPKMPRRHIPGRRWCRRALADRWRRPRDVTIAPRRATAGSYSGAA